MISKLESIQHKIYSLNDLQKVVTQWKLQSKQIVFTNGCFDILHQGHYTYLIQAAELGNKLIVGVNSDASIQQLKGKNRPIIDEYSRAFALASQTFVDAVILFNEETPKQLIESILPSILVKGGDYTIDKIVGANEVIANGGSVEIIPFLEGFSTTKIIDKIKTT